jgi:glycosyltransferase involved in cell wall biosynthesis
MKRILIYPEMEKYLMAHYEYLIRNLGKHYFMEQAVLTEAPYGDQRHLLGMRFHDSYDLLIPHFTNYTFLPKELHYKIACVTWDVSEPCWDKEQVVGATSWPIENIYDEKGVKYHRLRMGVDTEMFKPIELAREDDLLHIGFLGEYSNPRRNTAAVFNAMRDIPGTRFMTFAQIYYQPLDEMKEYLGGDEFFKTVVTGGKYWPGIPNCYNHIDVLVRLDTSYEYGFPVLEAAACGIPSVCTNMGNQRSIIEAGGAIGIEVFENGEFVGMESIQKQAREAVIMLRDNPTLRKEMGQKALKEVRDHWTWDNFVPAWKAFLDEGLGRAESGKPRV